jgi:hypothetical protein
LPTPIALTPRANAPATLGAKTKETHAVGLIGARMVARFSASDGGVAARMLACCCDVRELACRRSRIVSSTSVGGLLSTPTRPFRDRATFTSRHVLISLVTGQAFLSLPSEMKNARRHRLIDGRLVEVAQTITNYARDRLTALQSNATTVHRFTPREQHSEDCTSYVTTSLRMLALGWSVLELARHKNRPLR